MLDDIKDTKAMETKVERYEVASDNETGFVKPVEERATMGTVTITDLNELFLIPSPSADPRGLWIKMSKLSNVVLTFLIRPAQFTKLSQDCLHYSSIDFFELKSCAGVRIRWSPHVVYPYIHCGRCHLRGNYCADDLSFNVHGRW